MPPPFKVELAVHDPRWSAAAQVEASVLRAALGSNLLAVYHVGSAAIPGLRAKPILDLLPVVQNPGEVDLEREVVHRIGNEW
jgi:GrpB-like predicted nucleotidyltransferase (UPF0157 family)